MGYNKLFTDNDQHASALTAKSFCFRSTEWTGVWIGKSEKWKAFREETKMFKRKLWKHKEDFHYHCAHKFDKFDSKASKAVGVLLCNMCNPNEI